MQQYVEYIIASVICSYFLVTIEQHHYDSVSLGYPLPVSRDHKLLSRDRYLRRFSTVCIK